MVAGHIALTGTFDQLVHRFGLAPAGGHQTTCRAAMMVAKPWVRQWVGTASMSPSKKRALSIRVWRVSVLIRVRDASDDPGSLNAICPSVPIPRICRSTPPAARIASS